MPKYDALGGQITFTMSWDTRMTDLAFRRYLSELGDLADDPDTGRDFMGVCFLIAHTKDVTVHSDAPPFKAFADFWKLVRKGTKAPDLCAYYLENVHTAIIHAWDEGFQEVTKPLVTPAESAPELLTEEELDDPK